jgi:hypothetical protein
MNLGGFSWRRAIGLSAAKARLSRRIGIPLGYKTESIYRGSDSRRGDAQRKKKQRSSTRGEKSKKERLARMRGAIQEGRERLTPHCSSSRSVKDHLKPRSR